MTPQEQDQLVRRANARGFNTVPEYTVWLEKLAGFEPRRSDLHPPCPRCGSRSVNCPLSGPGCPYDEPAGSSMGTA